MLKFLVLIILLVLPSTSAAEWPMFQNDAQGTGFTGDIGPSDPEVKWKLDSALFTLQSPVIDEHGNIYVIKASVPGEDWSPIISAVSPEGKELWTYEFRRSALSNLAYSTRDGTVLTVASRPTDESRTVPLEGYDSESFLLALDSKTGKLKWMRRLSGNFTNPWLPHLAVDSKGVIYANGVDFLYSFTPDGTKLWSYNYAPKDAPKLSKQSTTRPVLSPDEKTVYMFRRYGGGLYAHDSKTGKKLWTLPGGYSDFSSPTVGPDGTIYMTVSGRENNVYALDPEGRVKWKKPFEGKVKNSSPAISGDGRYLFVDVANTAGHDGGFIYSLDPKSGEILWEFELPPAYVTSVLALDGAANIYYMHNDGSFYSITHTGKLRYKIYVGWDFPPTASESTKREQSFMAGPAMHEGRAYVIVGPANEYGMLMAIGDKGR